MGNDLFKGITEAELSPERVYFPPGFSGEVRLEEIRTKRGRKGDDYLVADFRIETSNLPERPVGSRATYIFSFRHEAALPNLKRLLAALNGIPLKGPDGRNNPKLDDITPDVCAYAVGDDQPLRGARAHLATNQTTSKGSGKPFTQHCWSPITT